MTDEPDPREAIALLLYVLTIVVMAVALPAIVMAWRWAF